MWPMLSSLPASQYCKVRKYARTSWAVPGMKRRIFGSRRSIFICCAPAVVLVLLSARLSAVCLALPRKRLSSETKPLAGADMSNLPMRVSCVTSAALIAQTIASHWLRRACSAGSSGMKWSSRKSIVTMTMSPVAMSALQRSSACSSLPHSSAA